MLKPTGRAKKAFDQGYQSRKNGQSRQENPHVYGPLQVLESWWDAGWAKADEEGSSDEN